jgi:ankyrin repeat protein
LIRDGADVDFVDMSDGFTALHHAVLSGFEDTVEELIVAGADINAVSLLSFSPLSLAALKARSNIVEQLLSRRASILVKEYGSSPLLHMACCSGDRSLVHSLLQKETVQQQLDLKSHIQLRKVAEFEVMPHAGEVFDGFLRPLHVASFFGRTEVVKYLLDMRNNVDETFEVTFEDTIETHGRKRFVKESKWTALMAAARNGHADTVCTLLARGGDPECETSSAETDFNSETALTMAATKGHSSCLLQLARWYKKHALSLDMLARTSAIHAAALAGQVECTRILLDHGSNVDHRGLEGFTPVIYAAHGGRLAVIELLARRRADLNAKADHGHSALMCASHSGHKESIQTLVRLGADVTLRNNTGESACHIAAKSGQCQCITRLVSAGADVNAVDAYGDTPLIMAAFNGHMLSIQTLQNLGASMSRRNKVGWSAAHFAARYGNSGCIETLAEYGTSLSDVSYGNETTPLILAAQHCHLDCVKSILRYAPDAHLFADADRGATAMHYAAWQGSTECVRYLVHHGDNINRLTYQGETPLDWLINLNPDLDAESKSEPVAALEQMGAKSRIMSAHNTRGETFDPRKGRIRHFWK